MDFLRQSHRKSTSFESRAECLSILPVLGSVTLSNLAAILLFIALNLHLLRIHVWVSIYAIHSVLGLVPESDMHPHVYCIARLEHDGGRCKGLWAY